jgi:Protein of unknown function (DUF3800)
MCCHRCRKQGAWVYTIRRREGDGVKVMFLDESGDHNLAKIDPRYTVFVLGGIIVDRTYARTTMRDCIRQLKLDFFDDPDIVLHTK